jgi:hypothetical protein
MLAQPSVGSDIVGIPSAASPSARYFHNRPMPVLRPPKAQFAISERSTATSVAIAIRRSLIGGMDVPAGDAVRLVAEQAGDGRLVSAKIGGETPSAAILSHILR